MTSKVSPPTRGEYGYDAPYALMAFTVGGAGFAAIAAVSAFDHQLRSAMWMTVYALFLWGNAFSFYYTTRRGKFQVWNEILDVLRLRGDEQVLDMGCGRGAVLTAVARRLTSGRATGIDLWRTRDQSGNAPEVTKQNAVLEGVADRIVLETGDMTAMPFADDTFDIVVSSLAIHNISGRSNRAKAIAEAWRVLKPGGRLAIADIRVTAHYAEELARLGASEVVRRRLGWRFWYGNPIAGTTLVTALKRNGRDLATRQ